MSEKQDKKWYIDESGPKMFSFDLTSACNFKCLHCYNDSGVKPSDELSNEEVIEVSRQIAEFKPESVCLCGGEATMRSNIIDVIKLLSPNVGVVNMVSNGYLFTKEKLIEFKEAGLNALQISLDGKDNMQNDTFRGVVGAFDKAVETIKLAVEVGLDVLISFIPNKLNFNTFDDYLDFAFSLGVGSVRVMPLIPMGRGSKINSLLLNSEEYCILQLKINNYKEKLKGTNQQLEWGDPLDHYTRLPNNEKYGYKSMTYEIKSNGDLTVSTYLPIVVGNVREKSLREHWENGYKDIWSNKKVLDYISKIENIYDINQLDPKPYSGSCYYINLNDD